MTSTLPLNGIAPLPHWGLIRAQGKDAAAFLHGQLTNDFVLLDLAHARLAGYCSAKGRLLASFVGWKTGPDEVLLACSADVLSATLKRLSMFVMRAQCKLSDATGEMQLYGITGPSAAAWLGASVPAEAWSLTQHEQAAVIRLPDAEGQLRCLWVAALGVPCPALPALDAAAWRWGEVHSGVATVEAAVADQLVPQMLNYELLGGVDFKKGCYPGQEIVARSQYRGTVKRRTLLFTASTPAQPGTEVFHSDDPSQPAGLVVNTALAPGGTVSAMLVEVKLAALASGSLHVGGPEGPLLTRLALPYPLPVDAPEAA